MKRILLLSIALIISGLIHAQQNLISIEGGLAIADLQEASTGMNGWRIAGVYEFNPYEDKLTHGISFGYINMQTEVTAGQNTTSYELANFPIYYAPGLILGKNKFRFQLKGALGWQFSTLNRTGKLVASKSTDGGLTLGAGAGGMFLIQPKLFLNFGYEFLWMNNSYYLDEYLSTIKIGLGYKF